MHKPTTTPATVASAPNVEPVRSYLLDLQDRICRALEKADGSARFSTAELEGERGGLARPRVASGGPLLEKAAVSFSHSAGQHLPELAEARRPELRSAVFDAVSTSVIVHPRNPYVPVVHLNLRLFLALPHGRPPRWWFGGGLDLTPCYGFEEDAVHWHRCARTACEDFGDDRYERCKRACDEYFRLPHRHETRGVGGLFFDDLSEPDFDACFAFVQSVGDGFLSAYLPIVERRRNTAYGDRERSFQLFRRGRYVEFNLLYDRGTRFGLEAGHRAESVLASLPPLACWPYDWRPEPGSAEERLREFLVPRDWLETSDHWT